MNLEKAKQRRAKFRDSLLKTAKLFGKNLVSVLGNSTIIVYGSVARGDFNRSSDIDVLVVSDALPERFLDRLDLLLTNASSSIEPKGYTVKEFQILMRKRNFSYMLKDKIVLYDALHLFS